jgi:hypothetical protein
LTNACAISRTAFVTEFPLILGQLPVVPFSLARKS